MFRMESAAARSPIDDFWYKPLSWNASTGHVSAESALRLAVVYACIGVLAQTVGHVPLPLYKRNSDGGKQRATDHWAYKLINLRPNEWQTPFEFREMMQGHLALRGNAYAWKKFAPDGSITDLIPLHPDKVQPQRVVGTMSLRYQYTDPDNKKWVLRQSEVLHLRGLSADGLIGLNPIEVQRITLGFGLTTQDYGRRFYENDASAGNWIEFPGKFKDKDAQDNFKDSWQTAQTGKNRFKTPVLTEGMKLHEMQLKNTDAQFLETLKYQGSDICRIFRMQPHKVGILDNATFSNIEQQSLEHVTDTLMPWFTRWEERLSLELLDEDDQQEYFFEFLVIGLLRGDSNARGNFYNKSILTGWMTRNEARILENMNPLPGLDEPLQPLNMQTPGQDEGQNQNVSDDKSDKTQPTDGDEQQQQPPKPGKKQKPKGRAALIEEHAASFLVKREIANARGIYGRQDKSAAKGAITAFYQDHAKMVSKILALDPVTANAWCLDSAKALHVAIDQEAAGVPSAYVGVLETWEQGRAAQLIERIYADA